MGKKKSWKRRVLKISLIFFGIVFLLLAGSVVYIMTLEPPKIELTEYYPFISAEAKEQILAMNRELEKIYWPAEFETRYIDTSYGKTFVRIAGPKDAPPLVLLHGQGVNSLVPWHGNIKVFSKEFRTYAVDTIGDRGLSTCTKPIKKPDDYTQWLNELFTGLGLNKNINLIGVSYGGWLAGQYAVRFPIRLSKVVLMEPGGTIVPMSQQHVVRYFLSLLPFQYFKDSYYSRMDPTAKKFPLNKQLQDFRTAYIKNSYKFTFSSSLPPTVLTDEELKSIKCSALFIVGEHERLYSPDEAIDRLEKVVPHFKKKIIPGVGHLTMSYSPLTTETIMAFLSE
jgi:pimeloyl-ACP methyl ester carboxylesterase